jgi:uncharacterized protein YqhQ
MRGDPLLRRTVFLLRFEEDEEFEEELEEDEFDEEEEEEEEELDEEDDGDGVLAFLDLALVFALVFGLACVVALPAALALAFRDPLAAFFRRSSRFHSDPST